MSIMIFKLKIVINSLCMKKEIYIFTWSIHVALIARRKTVDQRKNCSNIETSISKLRTSISFIAKRKIFSKLLSTIIYSEIDRTSKTGPKTPHRLFLLFKKKKRTDHFICRFNNRGTLCAALFKWLIRCLKPSGRHTMPLEVISRPHLLSIFSLSTLLLRSPPLYTVHARTPSPISIPFIPMYLISST